VIGAGCYTIDSGVTFTCYQYCDLYGGSHTCPSGSTCADVGHATVGVCETI
jgi:hypothetical protein